MSRIQVTESELFLMKWIDYQAKLLDAILGTEAREALDKHFNDCWKQAKKLVEKKNVPKFLKVKKDGK